MVRDIKRIAARFVGQKTFKSFTAVQEPFAAQDRLPCGAARGLHIRSGGKILTDQNGLKIR